MHEATYTRKELLKDLEQLRQKFEEAIRAFEQQQMEESVGHSVRLLDGMSGVVESLIKDYEKAVFHYKFSRMHELKSKLNEFDKKKNAKENLSEYTDLLMVLSKYLNKIETEIKNTYPPQKLWIEKIWKNKKFVWGGIAGIVLVAVSSIGLYRFSTRKCGLMGEYFRGTEFSGESERRRDKKIDFNWASRAPIVGWRKDDFSVRWTGYLFVPADGWVEILTQSDDGVRLWLGRDQLINNWTVHKKTTDRVYRELQRGYYPLKLEYFEKKKKAVVRLLWKHHRDTKPEIISSDFLIHSKEFLDPKIPLFE